MLDEVTQQVRLTLHERGIDYVRLDGALLVHYGSADVEIAFRSDTGTTIDVSSCVLDELELTPEREIQILRSINDRNRSLRFGAFHLDAEERKLYVRYELVGDFLQPEELMNALTAIAHVADDHDDLMMREFGTGRRGSDRAGRAEVVPAF